MPKTRDLLAGTMLTGLAILQPQIGSASATAAPLIVAQQQSDTPERRDQRERPATQERRQPTQGPAAQERRGEQPPAAREQQQRPAAQERPGQPPRPAAQDSQPPQRPAAQERREEQRPAAQERPAQQQPPAAQTRPAQPQRPTAQERPAQPQQPPAAQQRPGQPQQPTAQDRPAQQQQPPAAQQRPAQPQQPTAQERPAQQQQPPAAQTRPAQPQQPTAQDRPAQQPPAAQGQPVQQPPPAAQGQPAQQQPPAAQQRPAQPQQPTAAAPPPREQARDAREFLRQDRQGSTRGIEQVRQERRETREGDRVVIREPDRTIIREGGRTIIRHNETDRFTVNARDVRVERRGNETVSIVERSDGTRIVTVTDEDGRLIRRSRRDPAGREVVIIENDYSGPRRTESYYVELPPPVVRIPRERYIVEAERASPADIYAVLTAPPVERIDRRYTLDQVRYSAPLRERMPRVDLDTVTFDSGSWQLTPDQIDRLAVVADGLKRAIERHPREVFLIEGHTDAVGADVDNLSLSDRRAEAVAVALTERFGVPGENLTTQGYGEQYLKVATQDPERANRRVTARRITPLLDQQAGETSGARQ
jgi:outer membrane protein OmpA-like peptidoglycan-associated protein